MIGEVLTVNRDHVRESVIARLVNKLPYYVLLGIEVVHMRHLSLVSNCAASVDLGLDQAGLLEN